MKVTFSDLSGVTKAAVSGRMDTTGIDKQEALVTASIIPKGQNTIIDLTDVTFVASMGVRMLLTLARTLARRGAKLVLYGASPAVTEVASQKNGSTSIGKRAVRVSTDSLTPCSTGSSVAASSTPSASVA